ncbi:MAG: hypothetical protein ACK4GW_11725 [Pseudorhodobacter sp.]
MSELHEPFEYFLTEATHLGQKYRTVNDLFLCGPEIHDSMDKLAPDFFIEIYMVYRDSIFMNIARICDSERDRIGNKNISIAYWFENLKRLDLVNDELASCRSDLMQACNVEALREYRHKRLAHADLKTALERVEYTIPDWHAVHRFVTALERFSHLVADKIGFAPPFSIFLRNGNRHAELFRLFLAAADNLDLELSAKEKLFATIGNVSPPKLAG